MLLTNPFYKTLTPKGALQLAADTKEHDVIWYGAISDMPTKLWYRKSNGVITLTLGGIGSLITETPLIDIINEASPLRIRPTLPTEISPLINSGKFFDELIFPLTMRVLMSSDEEKYLTGPLSLKYSSTVGGCIISGRASPGTFFFKDISKIAFSDLTFTYLAAS